MTKTCKNPGNCEVVLVEDDKLLNAVLSMQLECAGINFCAASNGLQALALVRSHRPRVFILDVSMDGLSGFGVVDAIKKDPSCASDTMHLIVYTSQDLTTEERKRLSVGKTHFLTKTIGTDDMSAIVSRALKEGQL